VPLFVLFLGALFIIIDIFSIIEISFHSQVFCAEPFSVCKDPSQSLVHIVPGSS
jgi:hypothetical protein